MSTARIPRLLLFIWIAHAYTHSVPVTHCSIRDAYMPCFQHRRPISTFSQFSTTATLYTYHHPITQLNTSCAGHFACLHRFVSKRIHFLLLRHQWTHHRLTFQNRTAPSNGFSLEKSVIVWWTVIVQTITHRIQACSIYTAIDQIELKARFGFESETMYMVFVDKKLRLYPSIHRSQKRTGDFKNILLDLE